MNMAMARRAGTLGAQWIASIFLLLLIWQLVAATANGLFVSGPFDTIKEAGSWLGNGVAWQLTRVTLAEAFVGFVVGSIVGVLIAMVVGLASALVGRVLEPAIVALYAAPKFVLVPILFVWLGNGFIPRDILVVSAVAPVIATYTLTGIRTVDADRARMMQGLGASRRQLAAKLLLPHTMGYIATGEVYVLPHAMFVAIGAEVLFGISGGLGGTIYTQGELFNAKGVFAALLLATVVSAILSWLVALLGARLRR
jgi:NitT/TauT family transport system permease protein